MREYEVKKSKPFIISIGVYFRKVIKKTASEQQIEKSYKEFFFK